GRTWIFRAAEFPGSMEKETDIRLFQLRHRSWTRGKSSSPRWELRSRVPWNGNAAEKAFISVIRMGIYWSWQRPEFGRPTDGGFLYRVQRTPTCDRIFSCRLRNLFTKPLTRIGWGGRSLSPAFWFNRTESTRSSIPARPRRSKLCARVCGST